MNNNRRKRITDIVEKINELRQLLEDVSSEVEEVRDEEQEYLDNIPENLQGSERHGVAETAVENLENAYSLLEQFDCDELIGYLEEASQ